MYSDKQKKDYMRMYFNDQPSDFCEYTLNGLKLKDESRFLLHLKYVQKKTDKEIAIILFKNKITDTVLHPDNINKKVSNRLPEAYDALKHWQYKAYMTPK